MQAQVFYVLSLFCIIRLTYQTSYVCNSQLSCGCSRNSASVNARIVGGEVAQADTWSWAVSLKIEKSDSYYECGGTIIHELYVMTAAHCVVVADRPWEVNVFAGSLSVFNGEQRYAADIYVHPSYDSDKGTDDIAILKLNRPFELADPKLAKICLPNITATLEEYPKPDTSVIAVGWGTLYSGGPTSPVLRQVTVKAVAADDINCQLVIKDAKVQFCAGIMPGGGKDTCQGDSGGPLMMFNANQQWELVGVVSNGYGCAQPHLPGLYTRVSTYRDWINNLIKTPITSTSVYSTSTHTIGPKTTTPFLYNGANKNSIGILLLSAILYFVF